MGDQVNSRLLVDTGSADTWIERSPQAPPFGQATNSWIEVDYEDGSIQGDVRTAPLRIGELKVDSQAFSKFHEILGS
jgi:hypothetical protein